MKELTLFRSFLESINDSNPLIKSIIEAVDIIDGLNVDVDVKPGAVIDNLRPSIRDTIPITEQAYTDVLGEGYTPTITSGNDSTHSSNSKHYKNLALDWRTNDIKVSDAAKVTEIIKNRLGDSYYVDFEDAGTNNSHIHIQTRSPQLPPHNDAYYKNKQIEPKTKKPSEEKNIVNDVSKKLNTNPEWLYNLINFESGWNPRAENPVSSAKGLIQFIDSTSRELGYSNAHDLVRQNPTIEDQLTGPVYDYLKKYAPFPTEQSLYMAVFYPRARTWELDHSFPEHVKRVNPGIDVVGDYVNKVRNRSGESHIQIASKPPENVIKKNPGAKDLKVLKQADVSDFKKYAPVIIKTAKNKNIEPELALAYIHNASGYNPTKKSDNGRVGLFQIRKELAKKLHIEHATTEQNINTGVRLLKQYQSSFGNTEAAIAALYSDPSIIHDALIDIDRQYAKSEFPQTEWTRKGTYRGQSKNNLPPKTKARKRWHVLKTELNQQEPGDNKLTGFVDDVIKYTKLYDTVAEKYPDIETT